MAPSKIPEEPSTLTLGGDLSRKEARAKRERRDVRAAGLTDVGQAAREAPHLGTRPSQGCRSEGVAATAVLNFASSLRAKDESVICHLV